MFFLELAFELSIVTQTITLHSFRQFLTDYTFTECLLVNRVTWAHNLLGYEWKIQVNNK